MNEVDDSMKSEEISKDIPNNETINAMLELRNGGGESFNSLDDLWNSLEDK